MEPCSRVARLTAHIRSGIIGAMDEYGFVRIACAVPPVTVAGVHRNVDAMLRLLDRAGDEGADLVAFPELCLTGYACGDLFRQRRLLESAVTGLARFASESAGLPVAAVVGLPVEYRGLLLNCAAMVSGGRILGLVPKTYIPNYNEFYEDRWFASSKELTTLRNTTNDEWEHAGAIFSDSGGDSRPVAGRTGRHMGHSGLTVECAGQYIPIGTDLLFSIQGEGSTEAPSIGFNAQVGRTTPGHGSPGVLVGLEICEDLWSPIPPSTRAALHGAEVLVNISASNDLVGKIGYRTDLIRGQSARCLCAYAYSAAGVGESSTDTVYGGHTMIAENGTILAEGNRFSRAPVLTIADVDVDFLRHERRNYTTFREAVGIEGGGHGRIVTVPGPFSVRSLELKRTLVPHPFVPPDAHDLEDRCREIFRIQSAGLATRLAHIGCSSVCIGLSGGLDSTLALLVTVEAFRELGLNIEGIHCITMPGFGTSDRTRGNVDKLCASLSLNLETVDIRPACELHLKDIGHSGKPEDTAYENVQARQRTMVLMNKANMLGGIVIGTGDLSELALGWCTYNGDHMSMYGVNAGVPKTLVKFLVRYVAEKWASPETSSVLLDIVDTPISPELLPTDSDGAIAQKTEDTIGPYELHDFFLYHGIRCGFRPAKVLLMATLAFGEKYDKDTILKWLRVFYTRFFSQQFKRSCLPDGPKVGTIALSPRGDWRMPSDAKADEWLAELDEID